MTGSDQRRSRSQIKPKPVTASYLKNSALHYLDQRAATKAMLRTVLERRSKRRLQVKALEAQTAELIDNALAELIALGLLDDDKFAEARRASLERKGFPKRRIALGLRQKGLDRETVARAMSEDLDELGQARRFAERKRLGFWSLREASDERQQKELRAMMRAGFAFSIAVKALQGDEP